jgi:SAM-dependent MidA family methyltransferase
MTELGDLLVRRIRAEGPLPLSEVMAASLMHPEFGYYATRDPFGRSGDFITAPEISQMFGELIGLWAAVVWQSMGAPSRVLLVELGPGRGTLMADALRAMRGVPGLSAAVEPHLVEASPTLRKVQAETLSRPGAPGHGSEANTAPSWHDSIATLPDGPTILIANEFFDALPIAQLIRRTDGWHERCVDVADDALVWAEAPFPSPGPSLLGGLVSPLLEQRAQTGDLVEVCPTGISIARSLGERLVAHGGAALIIDYGYPAPAFGDTLQAVRAHEYADILSTLGEADLTAHVDFSALSKAAEEAGAVRHGPTDQGALLSALGIKARAAALSESALPRQRKDIEAALHRLIAAGEMGTLFKSVAWTSPGLPTPPGF